MSCLISIVGASSFFSDGSIEKWLNRLKEIDETGDVANQVITVDKGDITKLAVDAIVNAANKVQ